MLAKLGFDSAENGPLKVCHKLNQQLEKEVRIHIGLGDSTEVRQLVTVLVPKVQQCREELSSQAVGNALYGMQRLGDSHVVRKLVAALTPKV